MKSNKLMSVVTLPLKTEPWQADILNKRMELCRLVYNSLLARMQERLSRIESDPEYIEARSEIKRVYQIRDDKLKREAKKSRSYTEAVGTVNAMLRNNGFSEFELIKLSSREATAYGENISNRVSQYTIARPMWAAFDAYLNHDGRQVHLKKEGSLNSLATDGTSGIRFTTVDEKASETKNGGVVLSMSSAVPATSAA